MKSLFFVFAVVVMSAQAQASAGNCTDTLTMGSRFTEIEAVVSCGYGEGQGQQHTDCLLKAVDALADDSLVAVAGYVCGASYNVVTQKTNFTVAACSVNKIKMGSEPETAVKSCEKELRSAISGGVANKITGGSKMTEDECKAVYSNFVNRSSVTAAEYKKVQICLYNSMNQK